MIQFRIAPLRMAPLVRNLAGMDTSRSLLLVWWCGVLFIGDQIRVTMNRIE